MPISEAGGGEPLWGRDGRTIYYRLNDQIIALTVSLDGVPRVLSRRVAMIGNFEADALTTHPNYDVAPDGSFLMIRRIVSGIAPTIVYNWRREFRELLAARARGTVSP